MSPYRLTGPYLINCVFYNAWVRGFKNSKITFEVKKKEKKKWSFPSTEEILNGKPHFFSEVKES